MKLNNSFDAVCRPNVAFLGTAGLILGLAPGRGALGTQNEADHLVPSCPGQLDTIRLASASSLNWLAATSAATVMRSCVW